jgi:NDP-sugar pyrophosphorylase family protein
MKVLIPIAGKSSFFDDKNSPFSKPLVEIKGKSMIQHVIENLSSINDDFEFIFIVNSEDCKKFHLHNILRLLSEKCSVVKVNEETKGALCSILLGIKHINSKEELIICNGDQIIDCDFNEVLSSFRKKESDVGLITFNSVHPRWSYIRYDDDKNVVETAEKRPLSKHAIAGFYYFRQGLDFIKGAMKSIQKGSDINGMYYIAPSINQLILKNKKITAFEIVSEKYQSFYSPQKIREYENEGR